MTNDHYIGLMREQIRRMRLKGVEPETVTVCYEIYKALGKPRTFSGVYVDCDSRMKDGFEVR